MFGDRVGQATDEFNKRWASLSTKLADTLDNAGNNKVDPEVIGNMWVSRDDAHNYILIDDPAVQLRVDDICLCSTVEIMPIRTIKSGGMYGAYRPADVDADLGGFVRAEPALRCLEG